MSAPQAAAITACTACAAVGGAAAGGTFSSGAEAEEETPHTHDDLTEPKNLEPSTSAPEEEPKWYPLTVETNQSPYNEKIGKEYGHLLVAPYGVTDKLTQKWWDKSYKEFEKDHEGQTTRQFSNEFAKANVTSSFEASSVSQGTSKALNKVCNSIYSKTKDTDVSIFYSASPSENKDKLRDDLWKYCSPLGTSPINLSTQTDTFDTGKIGNSKKEVLLSAKEGENTKLWKIKQEQFFALKNVSEALFSDLVGDNKETNKNKANSLRDKCNEAYSKPATATGGQQPSPTVDVVEKYCSLKEIKEA